MFKISLTNLYLHHQHLKTNLYLLSSRLIIALYVLSLSTFITSPLYTINTIFLLFSFVIKMMYVIKRDQTLNKRPSSSVEVFLVELGFNNYGNFPFRIIHNYVCDEERERETPRLGCLSD